MNKDKRYVIKLETKDLEDRKEFEKTIYPDANIFLIKETRSFSSIYDIFAITEPMTKDKFVDWLIKINLNFDEKVKDYHNISSLEEKTKAKVIYEVRREANKSLMVRIIELKE